MKHEILYITFEHLDAGILAWDINIYIFHVSKYGYIYPKRNEFFIILTWKSVSIFPHQIWNPFYVTFDKTSINCPIRTNGIFCFIHENMFRCGMEFLLFHSWKFEWVLFNMKYRILHLSYLRIDFLQWNIKSQYFTYENLWTYFHT